MEHQDWKVVVLKKSNKKQSSETNNQYINRQKKNGTLTTIVKQKSNSSAINNQITTFNKLEKDAEECNFKHKTVPMSIAKRISKKRIELNLTQTELAKKLSIPENIIKSYEKIDGKTICNPNILNKLEKILGRIRD